MSSMKGKICLVTGGTSGVGRAAALGLAGLDATLVLTGRDSVRGEETIESCSRVSPSGEYHFIQTDLSSKAGITAMVDQVSARFGEIQVLLNCMGSLHPKRVVTADGIEATFFIDYLAHYMITTLLLDALKKGAPSRVLTVSGNPKMIAKVRLNHGDLQFESGYNGFRAVVHAALCKVMFTMDLSRRLEGMGVSVNTFHPGLVRTRLGRSLPLPLRAAVTVASPFMNDRSETAVYGASSPELRDVTGKFLVRQRPIAFSPPGWKEGDFEYLREESERLI